MPKAEKGSVKDIGKRIKAKGLQKLKFYCQMCEKQCRDANGFKCVSCLWVKFPESKSGNSTKLAKLTNSPLRFFDAHAQHVQSESHLRQMKIFSENASGIMDSYSKEFEKVFLDTLRMRHGTTKMMANRVYQEVIQDKSHIHMNATIWATLSDFCKYLGKTGKCVVEETERGWFITYIERDVAKMQREEALQRRLLAEQQAEKAAKERIDQQRREQAELGSAKMEEATKLQRAENEPAIKVAIQSTAVTKPKRKTGRVALGFGDNDDDDEVEDTNKEDPSPPIVASNSSVAPKRTERAAAEYRPPKEGQKRQSSETPEETPKSKKQRKSDLGTTEKVNETTTWLYRGIVVRIIDQDLADGKYFRRKAVVDKVIADHTAELTVLEPKEGKGDEITGDILQMDQDDLETVVPKQTGVKVRILRGPYRFKKAKLKKLDKAKYTAELKVDDTYVTLDFADFAQID